MMLTIEPVTDANGAARWHALDERAVPLDHPGLLAETLEQVEHLVRGDHDDFLALLWVASVDGVDVGYAQAWLPTRENLDLASLGVVVDPAHRRRGYGLELAEHVIGAVRDEGRRRAIFYTGAPIDAEGPGYALARRLGATEANEVRRRQLDLTGLDDATLQALLDDHVGRLADAYDVVTWEDRVPDEHVDDAARLMGRMSTDTPQGELSLEVEHWDAARYRDRERDVADAGLRRVAAGAVERATGRFVAYTDVGIPHSRSEVAWQWDTIVDPDHRGHRLGMLVKVANLRRLRTTFPEARSVQTYNAAVNEHMIAINELLGFVAVERSTHWNLAL